MLAGNLKRIRTLGISDGHPVIALIARQRTTGLSLGQGPGRAKDFVAEFGGDTPQKVHVRWYGRRHTTAVVRRADLADEADHAAPPRERPWRACRVELSPEVLGRVL